MSQLLTVGAAAIDRSSGYNIATATLIEGSNLAPCAGRLTTVYIWTLNNMASLKVGIFHVISGDNLSTRDWATVGPVVAGVLNTFAVDLAVESGDYIGCHRIAGGNGIEGDAAGGTHVWSAVGDQFPCINQAFVKTVGRIISLGGMITTIGSFPQIVGRAAFGSLPLADTPTWTDLSPYVIEFDIKRGRQQELGRIEAGTLTLVLNNEGGQLWPTANPNIKPRVRVNVRAAWGTNIYDRFTGYVESWLPSYRKEPDGEPIVTVTAVDGYSMLARQKLNVPGGWPVELTGTRVNRVLDVMGFPAADRTIDAGYVVMEATGDIVDVLALDHLALVQDSEHGLFFFREDGYAMFQDRHARYKPPLDAPLATFGDGVGESRIAGLTLNYSDNEILNDVRFTGAAGVEHVATDGTSQGDYGIISHILDLANTDECELDDYVGAILDLYKDVRLRIESVVVKPDWDPADLYPQVLLYTISNRIRLAMADPGIDEDYYIEGLHEQCSAENEVWRMDWWLSLADTAVYWLIGVPGRSEIGVTTVPGW